MVSSHLIPKIFLEEGRGKTPFFNPDYLNILPLYLWKLDTCHNPILSVEWVIYSCRETCTTIHHYLGQVHRSYLTISLEHNQHNN